MIDSSVIFHYFAVSQKMPLIGPIHLEPWAYLNYLFEKLPAAKSQHALVALLPQNLKMEDLKS